MNPNLEKALNIIAQLCDNAVLNGPDRRMVEQALSIVREAVQQKDKEAVQTKP